MIAYRDFEPTPPGTFSDVAASRMAFNSAVSSANEWIERESIEVLNIETLDRGGLPFWVRWPLMLRTLRVWYVTKP
jgi:hypothetical protein